MSIHESFHISKVAKYFGMCDMTQIRQLFENKIPHVGQDCSSSCVAFKLASNSIHYWSFQLWSVCFRPYAN